MSSAGVATRESCLQQKRPAAPALITHPELATLMLRFIYRCLQRVIVVERVCVLSASTQVFIEKMQPTNQAKRLSHSSLQGFILQEDAPYCEPLLDKITDPELCCVGVVQEGRLKSFAWFHVGAAKADMNYGKDARTATALSLPLDAAFVFHAYTAAAARGNRLMTQVLSEAAEMLHREQNIQHLVTTTEWTNSSARIAFRNAGFNEEWFYWRCVLGPWNFGVYPQPRDPILGFTTPENS